MKELGIYIHIPFCIQKCYYCDFISYTNKFDLQKEYINKVIEEIKQNEELIKNRDVTTIYIGGGTPSAIEAQYIKQILDDIYKITNINNKECEITIEVNPGTVTKEKLSMYKNCGINRISIGLQSTNDKLLKQIGRIHNYKDFLNTYNLVKQFGFKNVNVDLMLGLPNQNIEDLKQSLNILTSLELTHISVYSLIIEQGTKIEKMINQKQLSLPDEDEERNQYKYTKDYLELKGFKHYEISNFAKQGFESKHNINCWEQKEYIGIGAAAHSYINKIRYSNTECIDDYIIKDFKNIKIIHEKQDEKDMQKEYMLLGLRKLDGVKISDFKAKFGENPIYLFRKELDKLVKTDLITVDLDTIKLTYKGLDFANLVWEEFV